MALSWKTQLHTKLIEQYGKKPGEILFKKFQHAFSSSYTDDYPAAIAVNDIAYIQTLCDEHPLAIDFYSGHDDSLHIRLFQWQQSIALSDILPMLENLNLRTENERPHKAVLPDKKIAWISDFTVSYAQSTLDLKKVTLLFQDAFTNIYFGLSENDGFNKLILGAALSWRDVIILRMYAKYLYQVGFRFSQAYIERTLLNNTAITQDLIELFKCRHDPHRAEKSKNQASKIEKRILQALEAVSSLDEDYIFRRLLDLIKATLRTNYYQCDEAGKNKFYLSVKLHSRSIPEMPLPIPLYEIFVYAPQFEAIHLRYTKVARGGIRWSDRPEDFRTEILGLMKAQVVKNAVIVPSGAKGGFVLKGLPAQASREIIQREVIRCYKAFMCGLLDLTDNIKNNTFIRPKNVVCHDEADSYLVVAADKGTSNFSDIANSISAAYHFWLGDAFASGGSAGYDHKAIGITARGAWESIKRHFSELQIKAETAPITIAGIGDMSGDVFGNGMLYSKHVKLVAAFDHRHIFIDPNPHPESSYRERLRLFNLPVSSWADYNTKLISKGGGVFARTLKSIAITPQMKAALDIQATHLTPTELIRALLKAPVDLLFNGGVGTYVKASYQSNIEVGDRTNDYCRVDGNELRCKVVCEGGNLGLTQLGRIEYALNGGLINTDFIDNSAGVDCSDHEVNLKILLDKVVHQGKLSFKKRNTLLASLTKEVAALVLKDNYQQALVMSISATSAKKKIGLHTDYIKELETIGMLNRKVEYLPDDKQLIERKAAGLGLTRPELATLLAYTKIHIKQEILKSDLPEDIYLNQIIATAFPPAIHKHYQSAMQTHRLKRDIVATQLSNQVVNDMGMTFVYRSQMETGATVGEIIRAYVIASQIFETHKLKETIESLSCQIPIAEQYNMLHNLRNLINLSARWFLHSTHLKENLKDLIAEYTKHIKTLEPLIPNLMSGYTKEYFESLTDQFLKVGLGKKTAQRIATYRAIYTTLNIIEVATQNKFDLIKTAEVYFSGGERMNLVWFRDQLAKDTRDGHWNVLARLTIRDELDISQRALTIAIMKKSKKQEKSADLIQHWIESNERALERWDKLLSLLHSSTVTDYIMFFIAIRELIGLIVTSQ